VGFVYENRGHSFLCSFLAEHGVLMETLIRKVAAWERQW